MSAIESFLQRLTKVKGSGNKWIACCPAHADRSPSLAVRVVDDGRILLHCFAGCDVHRIVESVGMTISDLFPPDERRQANRDLTPRVRSAFFATDLMRIIGFEALVVMITAYDLSRGKPLVEADRSRLTLAYERIEEAMRYSNVE